MSLKMFDLTGRIALVTGSSRGIGLAIADVLLAAGAEVILNARGKAELEATRARLAARAARSTPSPSTSPSGRRRGEHRPHRPTSGDRHPFQHAGIQRRIPFTETEQTAEVMSVNLDAVFYVGQRSPAVWCPRNKIINTCSLASEVGRQTIALTPQRRAR